MFTYIAIGSREISSSAGALLTKGMVPVVPALIKETRFGGTGLI
jgi:hypothetical protein